MDKVLSLLGLCRKAGMLEGGFDMCREAARTGRAVLLVAAADVSEKTYKNLRYEAERAGIEAVRIEPDMAELSRACGLRAGVVAVNDRGFAGAIMKEYGNGPETNREKED